MRFNLLLTSTLLLSSLTSAILITQSAVALDCHCSSPTYKAKKIKRVRTSSKPRAVKSRTVKPNVSPNKPLNNKPLINKPLNNKPLINDDNNTPDQPYPLWPNYSSNTDQPQVSANGGRSANPNVPVHNSGNSTSTNVQVHKVPLTSPRRVDTWSAKVYGSYNTVSGKINPEIMISKRLGDKSSASVNLYATVGNTGYTVIPGHPGSDAVVRTEDQLTSFTPGRQYVAPADCDRSIFFWQDDQGLIRQTVKDEVFNDAQIAEKKSWIEHNGGVYYGTVVLPAGQTQLATSSIKKYEKVTIVEKPAVLPVPDRRKELSGVVPGVELGWDLINGVQITGGAKLVGSDVVPTVGLNINTASEGGFVSAGVRKSLSSRDAGTDLRLGGGIHF